MWDHSVPVLRYVTSWPSVENWVSAELERAQRYNRLRCLVKHVKILLERGLHW
jgi:hypothetical protein